MPVGKLQSLDDIVSGRSPASVPPCKSSSALPERRYCSPPLESYGLMSYWVSQRTYEIGLCAWPWARRGGECFAMILTQGLKVTLYGVAGGIVAALLLTRFLAALSVRCGGDRRTDLCDGNRIGTRVAIVATAVPAWRAARIDPLKSLGAE